MARPKGGGRLGGRAKGTPNKVGADVRLLAQEFTVEALQSLAVIMRTSDSDQARVAAIKEMLDRGHGRPTQPIAGDAENPLTTYVIFGEPELADAHAWQKQHSPISK